jgi:hypothetical protein
MTADRIVAIALACPGNYGVPLNRWSLRQLRGFLLRRGVVGSISVEGLRQVLRRAGITFQRTRTWKRSPDPTTRPKPAGCCACTAPPRVAARPATARWWSAWTSADR